MMSWLLVFLGGGLGSLCRYGIARCLPPIRLTEGEMPWATLLANVLACIVLGVGIGLVGRETLSRPMQLLLLTGFCGGFSTFSTFAMELVLLGEEGHYGVAAGYVLLSLAGGMVALGVAYGVTR